MKTLRQSEPTEMFRTIHGQGQTVTWRHMCLSDLEQYGQKDTVAENWQSGVSVLLGGFTETLQARWKDVVRFESIERELRTLKGQVSQLQYNQQTFVPIDTLAPEPLQVIRTFNVTVEPYEDEFRASFFDANLTAFGETRSEAIWNLKDIIAITFETLMDVGETKLGPGPARQLSVLREFIRNP
jgi:predicted RNase H-like HicB family nuclease